MTETAFQFMAVCKTFRSRDREEHPAIGNLSFTAAAGQVTCLVGPSGCGKTTALRLAAGLEIPDAGTVLTAGSSPAKGCAQIGYVPQQHTLMPWLRVIDNVALPLRIRSVTKAKRMEQAMNCLKRVGMEERALAFVHECSGGMQQRIMLARQLAQGATLWLLDEPFGALDEITRNRLQDLLLELVDQAGISMIFVTHSMREAVYLGDKVVVMSAAPGTVLREIPVDLPRPRDRLSHEFVEVVGELTLDRQER